MYPLYVVDKLYNLFMVYKDKKTFMNVISYL
jgi:hypothetical protein